jgi:hypothetical protein
MDPTRIDELRREVNEILIPGLSRSLGFRGYFLVEAGEGVLRSTSLFDTSAQAEDSSRVAADWLHEEKLGQIVPNPPNVIVRKVIAHETKTPILA